MSNDGGRLLGENFGSLQTTETDYRTSKQIKRNKWLSWLRGEKCIMVYKRLGIEKCYIFLKIFLNYQK